mmetsp:Transcript_29706/g.74705  ORF Transcript_29706/g.74705 Transcript_29706/m.74705 type:complete len:210 (-) Transcript_29706:346-975(-)
MRSISFSFFRTSKRISASSRSAMRRTLRFSNSAMCAARSMSLRKDFLISSFSASTPSRIFFHSLILKSRFFWSRSRSSSASRAASWSFQSHFFSKSRLVNSNCCCMCCASRSRASMVFCRTASSMRCSSTSCAFCTSNPRRTVSFSPSNPASSCAMSLSFSASCCFSSGTSCDRMWSFSASNCSIIFFFSASCMSTSAFFAASCSSMAF